MKNIKNTLTAILVMLIIAITGGLISPERTNATVEFMASNQMLDLSYHIMPIYTEAATTSNDTLVSQWIEIGSATNVAIFYFTDDTSYVKGSFEYRLGATATAINSLTADTLSLDTRGSASTGLSKGKVLRGYGLTTDLIPGANYVRFTMIWKTGSEATTTIGLGMIYQ